MLNTSKSVVDILYPGAETDTTPGQAKSQVQDDICTIVTADLDYYHANCRVSEDALYTRLGINSVAGIEGIWLWSGSAEEQIERIRAAGKAVHEYLLHNVAQQVHAAPEHAVLHLQMLCSTYNMRSFRRPAGDGKDILFSLDPIDKAVFDNEKYIPSTEGYYTIIGTGSARD